MTPEGPFLNAVQVDPIRDVFYIIFKFHFINLYIVINLINQSMSS